MSIVGAPVYGQSEREFGPALDLLTDSAWAVLKDHLHDHFFAMTTHLSVIKKFSRAREVITFHVAVSREEDTQVATASFSSDSSEERFDGIGIPGKEVDKGSVREAIRLALTRLNPILLDINPVHMDNDHADDFRRLGSVVYNNTWWRSS